MARRRKTSPIEDLLELVSLLPWWAGVMLALVSYVFLNGVAENEALKEAGAGKVGALASHVFWQSVAWVGQYLVPGVCLLGAAASAMKKAKLGRDVAGFPTLESMERSKSGAKKPEGQEQGAAGFGLFFAGVGVLVLPKLTESASVQGLLQALRPLGLVMLVVGFGMSLMVLWKLMMRDGKAIEADSQQTARPVPSSTPWTADANYDPAADRVAAEYRSILARSSAPGAPESLATGKDVERMLDLIEWRRFEAVVERCYQLQGFSTATKPHGADGGVDIKLYREEHAEELAGVVQCKHWGRRYVGVDALRALRGSMADFGAQVGYFVTSSTFTPEAVEFAAGNQIAVVERDRLVGLIMGFTADQRETVLKVALEGRYDVPTCASCGTKMMKRKPTKGGREFWGCVSYPRCRSVIRIGRAK